MRRLLLIILLAAESSSGASRVRTGADRLLEEPYWKILSGKRIGLITNASGVDSNLQSTAEILWSHPQVRLTALFGPEHGVWSAAQAGEVVAGSDRTFSLYGETRRPTPEMLKDVDILIYDIQETGTRFYSYISTLFESLKAAAEKGIPLIVLDRPNPLRGDRVEGPVLEESWRSFVGIFPMPIRYGMTPGELASFFNSEAKIGCDLTIVPMKGWRRSQWYDETGLTWVLPSPNMPTLDTATVYPGMCLIEGTNLSEGRGTTRPFELFGAPWLDSQKVVKRLSSMKIPGVRFRAQAFTPTFSKYSGELCHGIQVHVTDRNVFEPVVTALHILSAVQYIHTYRLLFNDSNFDRLAGNSWIRESLRSRVPVQQISRRWQQDLAEFKKKREKYLLYR
ncbi:MAG: DUF1343 domain-containing protein [Acidobacteria bacterium]|nr:DUF1343 domain-containing protein [Acidobacteriota bacterium]